MMYLHILIAILFVLIFWQAVVYVRTPQGHSTRKRILLYILLLFCVLGLTTYAYNNILQKEIKFFELVSPYPGSSLDIARTPFSIDTPYWTFSAPADSVHIFNWYRSRAKHAGWRVFGYGEGNDGRSTFVIELSTRTQIFVLLVPQKEGTRVSYTTEGSISLYTPRQ